PSNLPKFSPPPVPISTRGPTDLSQFSELSRVTPQFLGPRCDKRRDKCDPLSRLMDFFARKSPEYEQAQTVGQKGKNRAAKLPEDWGIEEQIQDCRHYRSSREWTPHNAHEMG